ncbi:hypothetical protein TVAG_226510 [Trichomonas vaginalis G3]|uniref:Uncharacterized protein n=1 Tax=Trichomonas vaginalis (strain ATCC PRA-98 / G3) TaxID=412133 RepID=A2ER85_TRIV3|nr:hypothetical protein TVAGG3_0411260 [Trichomonas vaginalis G3]EAY04838.1 hypothetical protein TVAG_226510 [Trichomonas vaginalis G3]KAI5535360.1 hypothetical protein TVAGG3_0411260 [Trichomonas vaginalis G3]|eukprot:XP_001317061.1 hypothetical protein [Trichomonas vaginalis G3]
MTIVFYVLFVKNTPNSAYYTAFLFTFFIIIPNPLAKIGFCVGAAIIFFFMKSDNYWLTVACLIIMPTAFVFPIFEPFNCRMKLLQDPYQRSFNYSSFYGKQLSYSVLKFIKPENSSSCVLIIGNQTLNEQLTLASKIKPENNQIFVEFVDFTHNTYNKEQHDILSKSKSVVLNIGDQKGYNSINLIYDFLNIHYTLFDRVTVINDLVAKQNSSDLIDISKIQTFSGEPSFVNSYFSCRLNQTEANCQDIIKQYKTTHPEENNFYFH